MIRDRSCQPSVNLKRLVRLVALAATCVVLAACREKQPEQKMDKENHVLQIWHLHLFFWEKHDRTPENTNELKTWASDLSNLPYTLEKLGMSSIDEAFVSPRDNEPYVLRKVAAEQMRKMTEGGAKEILAYEAEGVDGKRYVAYIVGGSDELDEAALKKLIGED